MIVVIYVQITEYEQLCNICASYFRCSDGDGYRCIIIRKKNNYEECKIYFLSNIVKTLEKNFNSILSRYLGSDADANINFRKEVLLVSVLKCLNT